jgi:Kef-type K+ transport system membrane component KefB
VGGGTELVVEAGVLVGALVIGQLSKRIPLIPPAFTEIIAGVFLSLLVGSHSYGHLLRAVFDAGVYVLALGGGLGIGGEAFSGVLRKGILVASVGVALVGTLSLLVAQLLGIHGLAAWFVTFAMVSTSIGVAARQFRKHDAYGRGVVHLTLAAALADDVFGLIALIVISVIGAASSHPSSLRIASQVLASLVIPGLSFVLPALYREARRSTVVLAIGVVVLIAGFLLGVSPVILGFASGIFLERLGLDQAQLTNRSLELLETTVVPGFFLLAGYQVVLGTVSLKAAALLAIVLLIALGVSRVVLVGVAHVPKGDRLILGIAMSPRAEVTLIVMAVGTADGYMTSSSYVGLVIMILVALLVASAGLERLLTSSTGGSGAD